MKITIRTIVVSCISLITNVIYAQPEQDKLGTKVIDIVKSYTPTIADAYKTRENMPAKDSVTIPKKQINYTIYSVPVASMFVPDKGKASRMQTDKKTGQLYNSYIALGAGNYTTLLGDAYITLPLNSMSELSFEAQHLSSQADVKGVDLDSNYANTSAQIGYRYGDEDYQFGVAADVRHRLLHWYGVEDKTILPQNPNLKQTYLNGGLAGFFSVNKSYFSGVKFLLQGIRDDYQSGETHFNINPEFNIEVAKNQSLNIGLKADYLQGKFEQSFENQLPIEYKSLLLGIEPSYHFSVKDFSIKAGFGAYYAKEKDEEKENNFKFFPDVEAAYNAYGDSFIIYGGVNGAIEQTTFREQSLINPYISPSQKLRPVFNQFNVFGGIKGTILSGLTYNLKANYGQIKNLAMFKANVRTLTPTQPFQYDNTYAIVYDDATHFGFLGEIGGKVADKFLFDISVKADSYSPEKEEKPWNIPSITTGISASYKILDQWNIGTSVFYVGSRNDVKHTLSNSPYGTLVPEKVTLDGFFDLNFNTDYTIAKRWTAFANLNNVIGKNYFRYTNYPVQGFQVLLGVKYQFNIKKN